MLYEYYIYFVFILYFLIHKKINFLYIKKHNSKFYLTLLITSKYYDLYKNSLNNLLNEKL